LCPWHQHKEDEEEEDKNANTAVPVKGKKMPPDSLGDFATKKIKSIEVKSNKRRMLRDARGNCEPKKWKSIEAEVHKEDHKENSSTDNDERGDAPPEKGDSSSTDEGDGPPEEGDSSSTDKDGPPKEITTRKKWRRSTSKGSDEEIKWNGSLEGPIFEKCENCYRWNCQEDELEVDENGWNRNEARDNMSAVASDAALCNWVNHPFTISQGERIKSPRGVLQETFLKITRIVKRPNFRWRGSFCFIQPPKQPKNHAKPWKESMNLCHHCKVYITGRDAEHDEFHERDASRAPWNAANNEYDQWKSDHSSQWQKYTASTTYHWPAKLWLLLCHERILTYQARDLWTMFPTSMRAWWHESVIRQKRWIFAPGARTEALKKKYIRSRLVDYAPINVQTREPNELEDFYDCPLVDGWIAKVQALRTEQHDLDHDMTFGRNMTSYHRSISQCYWTCKGFDSDPDKRHRHTFQFRNNPPAREAINPYAGCSYECPPPLFIDGSTEYLEAIKCKNMNVTSSLIHFFDKHLSLCNVKCPFGCNSFLFDCGVIDFEVVLFRYMDPIVNCKGTIQGNSDQLHARKSQDLLNGARDDFPWTDDVWIPQAKDCAVARDQRIRKVFLMTAKGPCIATCERHHGGTKLRYVHPPMNPVTRTLPSPFSAQLAPCVVIPRTVKPMRAHVYTTTYEVRECHGNYNGIDSAFVGEYGNLNLRSPLHDANLLLSLHHRQDVQGVLQKMVNKEVIDKTCSDDRLNGAAIMFDNSGADMSEADKLLTPDLQYIQDQYKMPIEDALHGATSISFVDSIVLESILARPVSCHDFARKCTLTHNLNENASLLPLSYRHSQLQHS